MDTSDPNSGPHACAAKYSNPQTVSQAKRQDSTDTRVLSIYVSSARVTLLVWKEATSPMPLPASPLVFSQDTERPDGSCVAGGGGGGGSALFPCGYSDVSKR